MTGDPVRQKHKDQLALGAAAVGLVAACLIWLLWVLPVARSVGEAEPESIGSTITVDVNAGAVGIWGSGIAPTLGTAECRVRDPDGRAVDVRDGPLLAWDDTLWWMTPKTGFEQFAQFIAPDDGVYEIACADTLETYDGEFLVAGDTFGTAAIGLGRSSVFAVGTLLAVGAVVCPLFAVLLAVIIPVRRWRDRRRPR